MAKKLGRSFVMVEIDKEYCPYAQKRLQIAETDTTIQGYADGVFWERNTLRDIKKKQQIELKGKDTLKLFHED